MMEHAATEDERLYYLENMLIMFSQSLFTQGIIMPNSRDAMYQTVEAGGLTGR